MKPTNVIVWLAAAFCGLFISNAFAQKPIELEMKDRKSVV